MIIRNTFSIGTSDIDRVETHQAASHFCQTGNCGTMLTLMHTRHAHKMGRYEFHGTTGQNLMIIEAQVQKDRCAVICFMGETVK